MAKILDTEVYGRYCLIGWIDSETGRVDSVEAVDGPFSAEDRAWLRRQMGKHQTVGFNSIPFDLPIIYGAINGYGVKALKRIANDIIEGGMRSWDIEREYKFEIPRLNHIDLIEVAPGAASLKIYNGRLGGQRMQDLPIPPDAILTDEDIETVFDYWKNDLQATLLLYRSMQTQLQLRADMGVEYKTEMRSKSDAQMAESVIKAEFRKLTGRDPKKPDDTSLRPFRYEIPSYIRFGKEYRRLNYILDRLEEHRFFVKRNGTVVEPEFLAEELIKIGNTEYQMGIGGLHSQEKKSGFAEDDEYVLFDRDVASFYPRIILNLGLFPAHLGKRFLKIYGAIVDRRLAAKEEAGKLKKEIEELEKSIKESNSRSELREERLVELKADWKRVNTITEGLKITINGLFGKFGNRYSIVFSPNLLIQTTITGQLSLLLLIAWMEEAGFQVISANTDGIIIRVKRSRMDDYHAVIKAWEKATAFQTEETPYAGVYSKDVNNYFAIKRDGSVKRKGLYAKAGLIEKKNPFFEICGDAVAEYIAKGTPMLQTIKGCRDIKKFVNVRTVRGGATKDGKYLGKAIRFYISKKTQTAIHYKIPNAHGTHNMVPKSQNGMPLMELPEEFPADSIDYAWYLKECRQILKDIGFEDDLVGKAKRKVKPKLSPERKSEIGGLA